MTSVLQQVARKLRRDAQASPLRGRIECPHRVPDGHDRCAAPLLPPMHWPLTWRVYPTALPSLERATGRGPVLPCTSCHRLVEIVIHR